MTIHKAKAASMSATAIAAAFTLAVLPASASGPTTAAQTILDANSDNRLEFGPGEGHVVRQELGTAQAGRQVRRQRLVHLGQLSDFQLADEESPLRLEWLDAASSLFSGAYRPEEAVGPQVVASMVKRLNGIQSPIDGATPDAFVVTGDSADSKQWNETRDFIDILDGGTVNPDSGRRGLAYPCSWSWLAEPYAGVRGGGQYYEPDTSNAGDDGPGYSPVEAQNYAARGRSVAVRDFPGLLRQAQGSFASAGLGAPWYSAMGNHDGLAQGNLPNPLLGLELDVIAKGCLKILAPGQDATTATLGRTYTRYLRYPTPRSALELARELRRVFGDGRPGGSDFGPSVVPEDPERDVITDEEWVTEHFSTSGAPVGHGFANRPGPGTAYYSVSPKQGIRYIVLNSVNDDGIASGRIDDPQFQWLDAELAAAETRGEYVIVFAHHTLKTMDNGFDLPPIEGQYHFGLEGVGGLPPHTRGESLQELFLRHPAVIAYVSGHEHENRVTPFSDASGPGRFWEISTAAHIDWPGQSRLIEVFDNRDGTLSIFATMVDHEANPDPGANPNLGDPLVQASVGRELTFNDWQASNGEDGTKDARGSQLDRNVELLLDSSCFGNGGWVC